MDINDIIKEADAAYDRDEPVLAYWNLKTRRPRKRPLFGMGDTLAKFIAIEIHETFDPKATDEEQLSEAHRVMDRAADQMQSVASKLMVMLQEKTMDAACEVPVKKGRKS